MLIGTLDETVKEDDRADGVENDKVEVVKVKADDQEDESTEEEKEIEEVGITTDDVKEEDKMLEIGDDDDEDDGIDDGQTKSGLSQLVTVNMDEIPLRPTRAVVG